MKEDFVENRRRALEDSFFANENARLIEKMRATVALDQQKKSLASVSGISNDQVLDSLIKAGINAQTLAAMSLAPMVIVAWADGKIEAAEKDAVLRGVADVGIKTESPATELVRNWLAQRPDAKLEEAWHSYVSSLKEAMEPGPFGELKADILGRARLVAESAGGFLGLSSPISKSESDALKRLEAAFT